MNKILYQKQLNYLILKHDAIKVNEELKDNLAKIKQNKQLPWLVSNVV